MDGVRIIQWDKRSAKRCFDKFDVLCLRGNDVLGDTQRYVLQNEPNFSVTNLPLDDENVYRTMRAGELIGIPQSASPAMRQAHIRIKTMDLKDAGIVQAAIRPGVGGAVKLNEFVARRAGKEYRLIHQDLCEVLDHTLGLVVFQEQIDQLLQKFGGYTSDEAEVIREGIYKLRREEYAQTVRAEIVARILANGYTLPVAHEVYELVARFQGYGFAQGHALAFAEVSVRSIYCQQNYPSEYFAAILNAQPAGYYGPATLANEARVRGVQILPPDVNRSEMIYRVEDVISTNDPKIVMPNGGIRVSLQQIGGISQNLREAILATRQEGLFQSIFEFVARVEIARDELERLILCGFFDSLSPNRRALLWAIPKAVEYGALIRSMRDALPLFIEDPEMPSGIADFRDTERAIYERSILDLDVEKHLMAFERPRVLAKGGITAAEASRLESRKNVFVVGNPIRLRFPPTASGKRVMFFDLEDETGLLNVTCFDDVYQRDGHKVICNQYITLWGEAQNRDGHIAFLAHRIYPYQPTLKDDAGYPAPLPLVTADFLMT
jgi:error-prone DNA polymerase